MSRKVNKGSVINLSGDDNDDDVDDGTNADKEDDAGADPGYSDKDDAESVETDDDSAEAEKANVGEDGINDGDIDDDVVEFPEEEPKARRSEADIRDEHLREGAVLLEFTRPANSSDADWHAWQLIERKGFKVASCGCLIPHQQHWFSSRARVVASTLAVWVFQKRRVNRNTIGTVNNDGWPCTEQVSHLCHCSECCNPRHLTVEPAWKNLRRNFCGSTGHCDCGMVPKCVRKYRAHNMPTSFMKASSPDFMNLVRILVGNDGIIKRPMNFYHAEDLKRRNRIKRQKAKKRSAPKQKAAAKGPTTTSSSLKRRNTDKE
jgi:hypothetical protein